MAAILCAAALSAACGPSSAALHPLQQSGISLSAVLKRTPAPAQATLQPGAPLGLATVQFVDAQDGWAGGNGVILATSDGGATWHTQFAGGGNVTGFSMLSATAGFAATSSGLLAIRNGLTWRRVSSQPLASVRFFSPQQGYALANVEVGGLPSFDILMTQDGGASWQTVNRVPLEAACFFTPRDGIAVSRPSNGPGLRISTTTDGGTSWSSEGTLQAAGYAQQLVCTPDGGAWMVVAGEGAMTQQSYSVFRSVDAGIAWSPVLAHPLGEGLPAPGNPIGVAPAPGTSPGPLTAIDKNHAMMLSVCYACGGIDGTLTLDRTSDGGQTWQLGKAPIVGKVPSTPMFLDMLSPDRAWLLTSPPTAGVPGPGWQSVIQATTDGGASWHAAAPGPLAPVGNVQFVNASVGYGIAAPGNPRMVLRTSDGGKTWRTAGSLPASLPGGYTALAVLTKGTLFVGSGPTLVVSHNGGAIFSQVKAPPAPYGYGLYSVAFSTPKTGCTAVASAKGWLDAATRDGGKTWRKASMQDVSSALCAENLVNPALARLAAQLVAHLSPPHRGKGSPPAQFASAVTAVGGGGALWLAFSGSAAQAGRLYVLGPGPKQLSVHSLPAAEQSIGGLSPLGPERAYLWTEDGRLFWTVDGGANWQQVAQR